jgi:hypothetical protein
MTVEKNGVLGLALNTSQTVAGDWTMYDKVGGSWNTSITSRSGKVGIGTTAPASKLTVAGEVQISNSGSACTAANEGALRYISWPKKIMFCNGTSWTNISSPTETAAPVQTFGVNDGGAGFEGQCPPGHFVTRFRVSYGSMSIYCSRLQ